MSTRSLRLLAVYLLAAVGGFAFYAAGLPLPWMIGPLVTTALVVFFGISDVRVPIATRPFGQGIVASQVGLSFTPAVFASLVSTAPMLVGMALVTCGTGLFAAFVLSQLARIPLSRALIATLPTSPVEAAVIGERYGFPVAPIILSQTMRISAVVVIIPTVVYFIDGAPEGGGSRFVGAFHPLGTLVLMLLAAAGVAVFRTLRISNPFFLGPLAASAAVTAAGVELPSYPSLMIWAAQIVLGTWMGSNLRRDLFTAAGRLLAASLMSTLLFVAATALIAVGLSQLLGMHWETLVLASTPGGVTEMALTAKFLGADVALITAFHITRIFLITPTIPLLIDRLHRRERA